MGEHARAWRAGHVVCLELSPRMAEVLHSTVDDLWRALTGQRKGRFGRRPRPLPDRRLFPDTYADRAAADAFRERHGEIMRDRVVIAVERTVALLAQACTGGFEPVVLTLDETATAEAFCALGHAQTLFVSRPRWNALVDWPTVTLRRGGKELTWLVTCQTALADAALADDGDEPVSQPDVRGLTQ